MSTKASTTPRCDNLSTKNATYCGKETEDGSRYCNACVRFLGDGGAKSRSVPKLGKALKEGEQIFIYDVFAASSGQAVRPFEENKFGRHCGTRGASCEWLGDSGTGRAARPGGGNIHPGPAGQQ